MPNNNNPNNSYYDIELTSEFKVRPFFSTQSYDITINLNKTFVVSSNPQCLMLFFKMNREKQKLVAPKVIYNSRKEQKRKFNHHTKVLRMTECFTRYCN